MLYYPALAVQVRTISVVNLLPAHLLKGRKTYLCQLVKTTRTIQLFLQEVLMKMLW